MKRRAVINRIKAEAKRQGLSFETSELTRHTEVRVGNTSKTLGRHTEVPDHVARMFFDQFSDALGKGWWR